MKPITIAGGGLAGLTLGIALRQQEVPVTVFEAGRYPRHRVCGEFISGQGRSVLTHLNLEELLLKAGAREARTAAFFTRHVHGHPQTLPCPALCLSRHLLDQLLADELQRRGGQLCQGERWRNGFGEGVVRATGRTISPATTGWRWFGLKVHARQVRLTADLEMHLTPHGYVGLCRLNSGEVNICGLFRSQTPVPDLANTWRHWLNGRGGSTLRERLAGAKFVDDSFCAVAGLQPDPQQTPSPTGCCIGDSIMMMPPLTGNGMSTAFESAALTALPLIAYSRGELKWPDACQIASLRCSQKFSRRVRWGSRLQSLFFHQNLAE